MAEPTVTFENLLSKAGDLGRWQLALYFFIGINGFFMGFQHLGSMFLAAAPEHWCSIPGLPADWGTRWPALKPLVLPRETRHDVERYSECLRFNADFAPLADWLAKDNGSLASAWSDSGFRNYTEMLNATSMESTYDTRECDHGWDYDTSTFTSTIVTEWHLVCHSKALMSTVQALYMGGVLVGCIVFGVISDRYGRRRAILIAQLQFSITASLAAFSPYLSIYLACRFLIGMAAPGIFACPFVLVTEFIGLRWRAILGVCYQAPFGVGYATLPAIAYLIRDWRTLQFAMSLPSLILLTSYWVLPESPRWLILKERYAEALAVLKQCSRVNRRQLPPDDEILTAMKQMREQDNTGSHSESKRELLKKIFQSRELCKRMIIGFYTWIVVAMVYYGLTFESPKIGGNLFFMVFLAGVLEIPAYLLGFVLVNRFGRRFMYCSTFQLAAVCSFAILIVPKSNILLSGWLSPTLAVTGKFFITIAFAIAYLYTAELFPTMVRNVAVNVGSMGGRFGSISAPYIVYELGYVHYTIPLVVFGSLAMSAGLLALFLPETMKANLAETIDDVEQKPQKLRRVAPSPDRKMLPNSDVPEEEIPLESNHNCNSK